VPKETDKHETREAILDAAERLLDRYGYGKMTMNDLAEEAGIGVGTTYLHFAGKADVAVGVVERFNAHVRGVLEQVARGDGSPERRLRDMLIARVMLRFDALRLHRHPLEEFKSAIQMGIEARRVRWIAAETEMVESLLEEGRTAGLFCVADIPATAETLIRATFCLMPKHLTPEDFACPARVRLKTEQLADLLMRALRPDLPPPPRCGTTEETAF